MFKVIVCDVFLVRPEGQGYFCVQPSLGEGVWGKWMAGHFSCKELRSGENRRLFLLNTCAKFAAEIAVVAVGTVFNVPVRELQ